MRPYIQPSDPAVTHVIWQGERMTVADYCARRSINAEMLQRRSDGFYTIAGALIEKLALEGWLSEHPTTGKPVEVVPREYYDRDCKIVARQVLEACQSWIER